MKRRAIITAAIATVGLAACGSSVAPTVSPTLALSVAPTGAPTVAPTPTATPAPTPTATSIPTPSPSDSPSPSPSASPCVPNYDSPEGSCETPPVVVVTACAEYPGTTQFGGSIAWSGADSADSFTIFPPDNNGYGEVLYTNGSTPPSGTYGPLEPGVFTYQFVDNVNEIINGSFAILTCAVPHA